MIGRPEWFKRRKYAGWGLMPATWQGWAYVATMVAVIFGVQALAFLDDEVRIGLMFAIALVFSADIVHMMMRQHVDERERIHEAVAERNALWVMLVVLGVGVAEQAAASAIRGSIRVDPVILAALVGALIAKAATNLYLDRKD